MKSFLRFLRGRSTSAPAPAPAPAPDPSPSPEPPPVEDLSSLGADERLLGWLQAALQNGTRALLFDPEEFSCFVCALGESTLEVVGECSLAEYQTALPLLSATDKRWFANGDSASQVSIYGSVTDLGQRMVLRFMPRDMTDAELEERRKTGIRLLNRLRPGTAMSKHNRQCLLALLERSGERPPPAFLERLRKAGLVSEEGDDLAAVLEQSVLPRKAVAQVVGEYLGVPFVDVEQDLPVADCAMLLSKQQVVEWEAIPYCEEKGALVVAVADPTDAALQAKLREALGRELKLRTAAATDIRVAADKIFRGVHAAADSPRGSEANADAETNPDSPPDSHS